MSAVIRLSRHEFSDSVQTYAHQKRVPYIDAVLALCEMNDIEPEAVVSLLSDPIRERLSAEGQELNILPKTAHLPIEY